MLFALVHYWLLSSLWVLLFVWTVEELRSVEVLLLWTDIILQIRFILSWEVYFHKFVLKDIRLANFLGCSSSSPSLLDLYCFLWDYVSVVLRFFGYSLIWAVYIDLLKLSCFPLANFEDVMGSIVSSSSRGKSVLRSALCFGFTYLMLRWLANCILFVIQINVSLFPFNYSECLGTFQTTFTLGAFAFSILMFLGRFVWLLDLRRAADKVLKYKFFNEVRSLNLWLILKYALKFIFQMLALLCLSWSAQIDAKVVLQLRSGVLLYLFKLKLIELLHRSHFMDPRSIHLRMANHLG